MRCQVSEEIAAFDTAISSSSNLLPAALLASALLKSIASPVYARVGRKLIESVGNESVVHDRTALEVFPVRPMGFRRAITRAIQNEDQEIASTRWSDALSSSGAPQAWGGSASARA
jgi:hypothetical protein